MNLGGIVMRKNFGAKPWTYPQPVFIIGTYDENGNPDAMNAAWGGISDTEELAICLSSSHKTVKNILKKKEFTVSMATEKYAAQCDYLGLESGNSVPDKIEKCGLHTFKAEFVDAPVIEELPMTLECRLNSYDEETGLMLCGIVNVSADESILTDGKIDPCKLKPITFDPINNQYRGLGDIAGNAFKDGLRFK